MTADMACRGTELLLVKCICKNRGCLCHLSKLTDKLRVLASLLQEAEHLGLPLLHAEYSPLKIFNLAHGPRLLLIELPEAGHQVDGCAAVLGSCSSPR
ncbi:unnamed protein product [Urochloa humidicola]